MSQQPNVKIERPLSVRERAVVDAVWPRGPAGQRPLSAADDADRLAREARAQREFSLASRWLIAVAVVVLVGWLANVGG